MHVCQKRADAVLAGLAVDELTCVALLGKANDSYLPQHG